MKLTSSELFCSFMYSPSVSTSIIATSPVLLELAVVLAVSSMRRFLAGFFPERGVVFPRFGDGVMFSLYVGKFKSKFIYGNYIVEFCTHVAVAFHFRKFFTK